MGKRRGRIAPLQLPAERLEQAIQSALKTARIAKRHNLSLAGSGFYPNKLLMQRANAANAFRELNLPSGGHATTLAQLIEVIFAPKSSPKARSSAANEAVFLLRTVGQSVAPTSKVGGNNTFFPLSIVEQTKRGYLTSIARQINGSLEANCPDACAVMMRRLLEVAVIEAFEGRGIAPKIKDEAGNYLQLTDLVSRTLGEPSWTLSRNAKSKLPSLRDLGHQSAHGRYFLARGEDLDRLRDGFRLVVEELLHLSGLL